MRPSDVESAVRDPERLRALRETGLLEATPVETFDRVARVARELLDVPVAMVNLVDADRQVYRSCIGLSDRMEVEEPGDPLSRSYCKYVVASGEPLVAEDARQHPLLEGNPAIEELGAIAYLGVPLATRDGQVLGTHCVLDHEPRDWTERELDLLRDLAEVASTEVALRRQRARLEGVREELDEEVEQRTAELEESRELLREAQRVARVGSWEWRPDGDEARWSRQMYRMLGYDPGEVEPSYGAFLRRVHPDDREEVERLAEAVRGGRDRFETRLRLRLPDGEVRRVRTRAHADAADGDGLRLLGITQDVTERTRTLEKLRRSERRYRQLFENSVAGVYRARVGGGLVECNEAFAEMFGFDSPEDAVGTPGQEFFFSAETRREELEELAEAGAIRNRELELRRQDGEPIWVLLNAVMFGDGGPEGSIIHGTMIDISGRREREERLRRSEERYRELFERNVAGVFRSTPGGTILECNQALAEMLGYDGPADLEGRDARVLYPSEEEREGYMRRLREREALENEELELRTRDGEPVWVLENSFLSEDPETGETVIQGTMVDITGRKEAEVRLEEMAYRDPLTGLGNRRMLNDQAGRYFSLAERRERYVGLAYLDLNRFKQVNDRWGHDAGDEVLAEIADRLRSQSRGSDLVARVGGDEFVVLLADLDGPEEVVTATRRLTASFDAPVALEEEKVVSVDVSVGVSVYPEDGEDLDALLRRADRALHRAEERGGRIARYQPETDVALREASELEREIRQGLEAGDFLLHYQPVVDLGGRGLRGAEALVRWDHPERGLLEASDFVPEAERSGVIREIDEWVLERAVRRLAAWQSSGDGPGWLSVNLSPLSFRDREALRWTASLLSDAELPDRGALVLEVTESEAMQDPAVTQEVLRGFREVGVRVALDDFGTGHSSLAYLDQFPADLVKLDRRFVAKIGEDGDNRLVRAMIELAEHLELATVAEGVEEEPQAAWLASADCDCAQGFLFGRPARAAALASAPREGEAAG